MDINIIDKANATMDKYFEKHPGQKIFTYFDGSVNRNVRGEYNKS